MEKAEFLILLEKFQNDQTTAEEVQMVYNYLDSFQHEEVPAIHLAVIKTRNEYKLLETVQSPTYAPENRVVAINRSKYWAAAILLILFGAGTVYLYSNNRALQTISATQANATIEPGKFGAIITLADGTTQVLDSSQSGAVVFKNGQYQLQTSADGVINIADHPNNDILVTMQNSSEHSVNTFNTVATPVGRQFRLVLPDGSKAWLNANSSIKFPTRFTKEARKVSITGEVYFDIKSDPQQPLLVTANNKVDIEVLGTRFNVSAYEEENALNTTLLEGAVKVWNKAANKSTAIILNPGENVAAKGDKLTITALKDAEAHIAWINGKFYFESADLGMVLRQIARWYGVNFKFPQPIDASFSGSVYRSEKLESLLELIEFTCNIHFKRNGNEFEVAINN